VTFAVIASRAPILGHMRAMFSGAQVDEYNATDLKAHSWGTVGVIYYRWHRPQPPSRRCVCPMVAS
jgi:hypothetical protein